MYQLYAGSVVGLELDSLDVCEKRTKITINLPGFRNYEDREVLFDVSGVSCAKCHQTA